MGVVLDFSIRFGDILTVTGFLAGGLGAFFIVRGDLKMLAATVASQSEELKEMKEVIRAQALQGQRLDFLDRQIEDLRQGIGFKIHREFSSSQATLFEPPKA